MIIDPDFFDHWKTRYLVELLGGDEAAISYIGRLWGHCQVRRTDRFDNLPTMALKAICKYDGDPAKLESSMIAAGWIERDGATLIVSKFREYNAKLFRNWENGKKGGRPSGDDSEEPNEEPKGNPAKTQGKPKGNPPRKSENPTGTNRSREDRIEEEERREDLRTASAVSAEQSSAASEFAFPTTGKGASTWTLPASKLSEYLESYPGVDVRAELRKARQYVRDHVRKRKTAGGMLAFLTRWLNRATDRGSPGGGGGGFSTRTQRNADAIDEFTQMKLPGEES